MGLGVEAWSGGTYVQGLPPSRPPSVSLRPRVPGPQAQLPRVTGVKESHDSMGKPGAQRLQDWPSVPSTPTCA